MLHRPSTAGFSARRLISTVGLAALSLQALSAAAGPMPRADLKLELAAPASVDILRPTAYTVTVTNLGTQTSGDVTVRVSFPLTNTSPQLTILGTVSGLDPRCALVGNGLTCTLAGLRKGWSTTFSYTYTAPVSTRPLQMTASASTSTSQDPVSANNSASVVPNLVYPVRAITASPITTRLCTGTALSSFFECQRFPSSISSFAATLEGDGSIGLGEPGYSGRWSQNAARTSLSMAFYQDGGSGPVLVSQFNGWAVNGSNCFQGMTTHVGSSYVSPYEVCLP